MGDRRHHISTSQPTQVGDPEGFGQLVQEPASHELLREGGRLFWKAKKTLNIINYTLKGVHSGTLGTRWVEEGTPEGRFRSHGGLVGLLRCPEKNQAHGLATSVRCL